MIDSFFRNRAWALWAWGGLLLLLGTIVIETLIQVRLNEWYGEMWDLMQVPNPENIGEFWRLIIVFCSLAFPFICLRVASSFFAQHYAFRWRQAITQAYLPYWERAGQDIEGASQRLQQDPERFARIVENLGLGLFRSVLTLIAFVPILATLSQEVVESFHTWRDSLAASEIPPILQNHGAEIQEKFPPLMETIGDGQTPAALGGIEFMATLPYSLVWIGIAIALLGTVGSYFVGLKLPGLEYNNQRVEARFRKRLVYAEDNKDFADVPSLLELFTGLRFNYFRLYLHYSYFGLWANFFGQFVIIADLLLIGPGLIYGVLMLGVLNRVGHAFQRVTDSFAYFVDNWIQVTELLSIIKRLREFERAIGYGGKTPSTEGLEGVQEIR